MKAKPTYIALLAINLLLALVLYFTHTLDGLLHNGTILEFYFEYALVLITLLCVYLALRLIKKNIVMRMCLLMIPMLANIILFFACRLGDYTNDRFLYLATLCAIGYIFVYPAKVENEEDLRHE